MGNGDVLRPALEWRIFRRIEPFERELVVVDPLDGGEPEAVKLALLVAEGGQHPRADPKGLSRSVALSCVSVAGAAGVARDGPAVIAPPPHVRVLF